MPKIKLIQDNFPKSEGHYLFRGAFSNDFYLIEVKWFPESFEGSGYWGDVLCCGRNVKAYIGFFSNKLEFEY